MQKSTLFVRDIDRMDSGIWHPGIGIIGHSYYVDIYLEGDVDQNGFILDFSILKKRIKRKLKSTLDHSLIIPTLSDIEICYLDDDRRTIKVTENHWGYWGPRDGVTLIEVKSVDIKTLENELEKLCYEELPERVSKLKVTLREESSSDEATFFHYTHGITGHSGNCQRLFHGHRSRLEVMVNGRIQSELAKQFVRAFPRRVVHIVGRNQISSESSQSIEISYEGNQGTFGGSVPREHALILDGETSIETISKAMANSISSNLQLKSNDRLEVICYEGIDKGSIGVISSHCKN